jgi:A/G-specific adenine glycosylase
MGADFARTLLDWWLAAGRKDLPWQRDVTPYRVWVSEIMLQQTQVTTVIPYFLRFMEAFPNVAALANAPIDEVLQYWSGLGYYARARNLYKAAHDLCEHHGGEFPSDIEDAMALPGVGRSTAGAILALSMGQRHPILDGNVKRVLARFHAIPGWPGQCSVSAELWKQAERHTPRDDVAAYTQAIMDLGATVCTPNNPACTACPLNAMCEGYRTGCPTDFPGKREKKARRRRHTHMILAICMEHLYLEQRSPSGIWGGLWSLPEFPNEASLLDWCGQRLKAVPLRVERWAPILHSFTHYDLDIRPVAVRLGSNGSTLESADPGIWYRYREAPRFGLAAPVKKLIDKVRADANR